MTTLLTGGTGFVGQKLLKHLPSVVITSRNKAKAQSKLSIPASQIIEWNPSSEKLTIPTGIAVDSVINLMGEPIAEGRWTTAKKQRIRDSRVDGTRQLIDALLEANQLPRVFVSASAIGIYGDSGEAVVTESHHHGSGYLTDVCEAWEAETNRISDLGVRVVNLRIGIVIGDQGGALEKMVPLFKWGLGGRLGSGKQWMAWIHIDDLVSMIQWAMQTESVSGPVNATAPNPVRNADFTKSLAKTVGRPAFLPVPKFALRLALGEFANSLFFSQRVIPSVALENGFQFKFTDIRSALADAIN